MISMANQQLYYYQSYKQKSGCIIDTDIPLVQQQISFLLLNITWLAMVSFLSFWYHQLALASTSRNHWKGHMSPWNLLCISGFLNPTLLHWGQLDSRHYTLLQPPLSM